MEFSFMNSKKEEVKVFLPEEELDKETLKQIKNLSNNPTVNHPRFMPDTHKGYGCCVGFTSLIKNGLIPLYVGGDTKVESSTGATNASSVAALQVVGGAAIGQGAGLGRLGRAGASYRAVHDLHAVAECGMQ